MKIQQLLSDIQPKIQAGVYDCIAQGGDYYSQEFEYGKAFIGVELSRYGAVDVWVCHDDCEHTSPRVRESVLDIMPHWASVEAEVERDQENWQDDFEVYGLYN